MRPQLAFSWLFVYWQHKIVSKLFSNKNYAKSEQNHAKYPVFTQNFCTSLTPRKIRNTEKSFHFRTLRWTGFLMIPLIFLYVEYIDRPKLSEQKKTRLSI